MTLLSLLVMAILAGLLALITVAFFHLRRRHRLARNTLNPVRIERDEARWQLAQRDQALA